MSLYQVFSHVLVLVRTTNILENIEGDFQMQTRQTFFKIH